MEIVYLEDDLAMAASQILMTFYEAGRFGRSRGFGVSETTVRAIRSDYVHLAGSMMGFTIQISRATFFEGSHPWWVWIEKVS
jgi:hypothetical protein